jgi:ATP-binding cassette, subfamily A (ABC1), member 5
VFSSFFHPSQQYFPCFRCLGSTQHLKNRYGAGYNLEIKLKHSDSMNSSSFENIQHHIKKECRNFVYELFPDAKVEESFGDRIVCSIPQSNVSSLAQSFECLEKGKSLKNQQKLSCLNFVDQFSAKASIGIEEYSFSQTTLEQVFLKLAHFDEEISEVQIE